MSKYCPNCGRELPDEAEFCDECGTRIPHAEEKRAERRTEPVKAKEKKRSGGGILKLLFTAVILFGLFAGGMWLWNKWHYNPALDGDVYSGPSTNTDTNTTVNNPIISQENSGSVEQSGSNTSAADNQETAGTDIPVQSDYDVSKLRFDDFDFYGKYVVEGMPDGGERIYLVNANGDWKYNIAIYNEDGSYFSELGYAELSVSNNATPPVTLVLHPRLANDGYETYDEDDSSVGYEPFGGGRDDNDQLKLTGNDCVVLLKDYYVCEGREYMVGELWLSEETCGDFLMVRGQE